MKFAENNTFTNQYSLSKTLRFELVPQGKTRENMNTQFEYDSDMQTFLKDQRIEDAYQTLKPVLDGIHEEFITESLESEQAKGIDFVAYADMYTKLHNENKKELEKYAKEIRLKIGKVFDMIAYNWREHEGRNEKDKYFFENSNYKILTEKYILEYIKKHINKLGSKKEKQEQILKAVDTFYKFFTYFIGFNQNRENYYTTKDEKSTAVATRIVHVNFPKFYDNAIQFEYFVKKTKNKKTGKTEEEKIERKEEYKNAYQYVKANNTITQIKDAETDKMIELSPIEEKIFDIQYFNKCFSQQGIEEYNRIIGHYNALINLYNQTKNEKERHLPKDQKTFKDLQKFKKLHKQIGCGRKDSLFEKITNLTKEDAETERASGKIALSMEEVLHVAYDSGKKYLVDSHDDKNIEHAIQTVFDFAKMIKNHPTFEGVYWSKAAINTISGIYLKNWYSIMERLADEKIFSRSDKRGGKRPVIPAFVELSELFGVIDESVDDTWKIEDVSFNKSLTEKIEKNKVQEEINAERRKIIANAQKPSEALVNMICFDIEREANVFMNEAKDIANMDSAIYKKTEGKKQIKTWLEHALSVSRIIKYFIVREEKIKGNPADAKILNGAEYLLETNWFHMYDMIRNYVTKKPQDDAKENKLKLNFENGSLLGGFSDGQEKNKASVILKKDNEYYLGILNKKSVFDTSKEDNPIYVKESNSHRLILRNLKFQTLAGKGFLSEFGKSYGEMGKEDSIKAIKSLQKIIKERYADKYPLLEQIAKNNYTDKKAFDQDIREKLLNCYECRFTPIDWSLVSKFVEDGDMFLFKIFSKDNRKKQTGNPDLQTMYWNTVFIDNSSFQLNAGGEIFYRPEVFTPEIKRNEKGEKIKDWIIKNKRFTREKFLFHIPILVNYKSKKYQEPKFGLKEINQKINKEIKKESNVAFLGLDRGEKHLVYYSLVDANGNMIDQGSFNKINKTDYNAKLEKIEKERMSARKNWEEIGTIKEMKEGYISHVVRKIVDIVLEHNALIVMEDLNTAFKRGRQKIEKSVYQKFELALAKKLNFLVDKSKQNGEVGSVTNALQLTPPVQNYGDIEKKKQVGIILYTRANYTSTTDPVTGWRKTIYLKKGSEESIKQQIENEFSDIYFDGKDYCFKYSDKNTKKEWILYSGVYGKTLDRFRNKKQEGENGKYDFVPVGKDVVKILEKIFTNFDKSRSLKNQWINEDVTLQKYDDDSAWESLRFGIDLIQQIRNTGSNEQDNDFLQSPVRDKNNTGEHFDSRLVKNEKLPRNGDANGAFNIARKGIMMYDRIKEDKEDDLYILDEHWDTYAQKIR